MNVAAAQAQALSLALDGMRQQRDQAVAERQQAIDARDKQREISRQLRVQLDAANTVYTSGLSSKRERELEVRCEQAIDALREWLEWAEHVAAPEGDPVHEIAARSRALLSLGEQP